LAQVWGVLVALLISPVLGLVLSIVVYVVLKFTVRRRDLYLPPEGDRPPIWWIRALLITTCTGVSFSHGTNDGQKSIGLINAKIEHDRLLHSVEYAPWWVRILSAFCLGAGTMIGYRRIVKTLGERLGKTHLVPAQGASAELAAAALVGYAGFGGYPVSTTHVVTGGIAGTMLASGAGLQLSTLSLIGVAWVLTLPATIAMSCGLFLLLR
jgi:phosphate/sulfate permease